jgi:hypothetical protein
MQLRPHYLQPAHKTNFEIELFATINRLGANKENARFLYADLSSGDRTADRQLLSKQTW